MTLLHGLNLINSLFLSRDQMLALTGLIEEWRSVAEGVRVELDGRREEATSALAALRILVEVDRLPDEALARRIRDHELALHARVQHAHMQLERIAGRALALLEPNQIDLVAAYNPCLVPHEDKANPGRIGAVEVPGNIVAGLEKLRRANGLVYRGARWYLARKAAADLKSKVPRIDEDAVRSRVAAFFDRVRSMDDLEWTGNRHDLVRKEIEELMAMAGFRHPPGQVGEKIAKHLLDVRLLPVLRARLAAPSRASPRADLAGIPSRSGCEGPRCAPVAR